jgi:hypothetical protein
MVSFLSRRKNLEDQDKIKNLSFLSFRLLNKTGKKLLQLFAALFLSEQAKKKTNKSSSTFPSTFSPPSAIARQQT